MPPRLTEARITKALHDQGYSPEVIATVLEKPVGQLSLTRTELNPQDKELAAAVRGLSWKMIRAAEWIIDNGAPDQQIALMRSFLPGMVKLVGTETSTQSVEAKAALDRLWASQREVAGDAEIRQLPTPKDSHAAPPSVKPPDAVVGGKRPARQPDPEVDE